MYVQNIIKNLHIICLQENWIFNFEKYTFQTLFPNHRSLIKCIDDDNPISAKEIVRGYGGVAILWREDIDFACKELPDGGRRIAAISAQPSDEKLCIITVYMACRENTDSERLFSETIDELYETITKYSEDNRVMLADRFFNSSLHWNVPNLYGRLLNWFLTQINLLPSHLYPKAPTLYHHNGTHTSKLITYSWTGRCS